MMDPRLMMRRVTVESIIGLAHNSQGNYQLISIEELTSSTEMVFYLFHPYRGVDGSEAKRITITITAD